MRKNRMMRLASALLILTMVTTCAISGTFAKYTTSVTSNDTARVATWGFTQTSMDITGLFSTAYEQGEGVDSKVLGYADIIAPGTTNSASFQFKYDGQEDAPEVAYNFTVAVTENCDTLIKDNKNIQWRLNHTVNGSTTSGTWGTWDSMIAAIKNLSGEADGSKDYAAQELPTAFSANDDTYTIEWQWLFEGGSETYSVNSQTLDQNEYDTYMGNQAALDKCSIEITITATQID